MEKAMKNQENDLKTLIKKVGLLKKLPLKKLGDATCDIIDLKGSSIAVLLRRLPEFSPARQKVIAQKIEDYFYFYPDRGRKLIGRLKKACEKVCEECLSQLLSILVDVIPRNARKVEFADLLPTALKVLDSGCDYPRKSKALEIIGQHQRKETILCVIKNMILSIELVSGFSGYQFFENCLLVLKRMGGESVLKLLINPNSDNVIKQFRFEWRDQDNDIQSGVLKLLQAAGTDFAQIALKIVDLSDFNLPFIAMIQEGMTHEDKWVRQAAAASMEKASSALDPEMLQRMLSDDSPEVRLMAVSSLGGYSVEQTGQLLESLVQKPGETVGARMNALYALYSQKNLPALERLSREPDAKIALNSMGLAALLKPKSDGFAELLSVFSGLNSERAAELQYYLLEISDPEDIQSLIDYHKTASSSIKRENCLALLRAFLGKKAGPRLERAVAALPDAERKALSLLAAESFA